MAFSSSNMFLQIILLFCLITTSLGTSRLTESTQQQMAFQYHKGQLLSGKTPINLIWYGKFTPSQRAIITDFITSLSSSSSSTQQPQPSVATWWNTIGKYYHLTNSKNNKPISISLVNQAIDQTYSLGKSLTSNQLIHLASKCGQQVNAINIVLTSSDVAVEGFCSSRCGTHGSSYISKNTHQKFTYIWVGNS